MKIYWGNEGVYPLIFNLDTRWPRYLQAKSPRYPLDRRLGESQSRWGHSEGKKFHHFSCRKLNTGRPAHSLVTTLTELPRCILILSSHLREGLAE